MDVFMQKKMDLYNYALHILIHAH